MYSLNRKAITRSGDRSLMQLPCQKNSKSYSSLGLLQPEGQGLLEKRGLWHDCRGDVDGRRGGVQEVRVRGEQVAPEKEVMPVGKVGLTEGGANRADFDVPGRLREGLCYQRNTSGRTGRKSSTAPRRPPSNVISARCPAASASSIAPARATAAAAADGRPTHGPQSRTPVISRKPTG